MVAASQGNTRKLTETKQAFEYYQLLGLQREHECKSSDIRRAYYLMALKHHPDRMGSRSSDEIIESTTLFKRIGRAYEVLGDQNLKMLYDQNGGFDPEDIVSVGSRHYADLFDVVTTAHLDTFQSVYKGSAEEREDVLRSYSIRKGEISKIVDDVFFASVHDEDRFIALIQEAINSKEIESLPGFEEIAANPKDFKRKQAKRMRKADKEAKEAEKALEQLKMKDSSNRNKNEKSEKNKDSDQSPNHNEDVGLVAMIRKRQAGRLDDLVERLETKYTLARSKK